MLTENVTQANEHTHLPRARTKDLVVNELPDEVLVYDLNRHKAHCLNQTAAQIWHLCDGQRTVPEIARTLARDLDKPVDEEVVWLALGQLSKSHLLEQEMVRANATSRFSRRVAVRRLGLGAALALPIVMSIVAPTTVSAASCVSTQGGTCTGTTCCTTPTTICCGSSAHPSQQGKCSRTAGAPCGSNSDCCSQSCSGPSGSKTCDPCTGGNPCSSFSVPKH